MYLHPRRIIAAADVFEMTLDSPDGTMMTISSTMMPTMIQIRMRMSFHHIYGRQMSVFALGHIGKKLSVETRV